jgi:hypothetical protein
MSVRFDPLLTRSLADEIGRRWEGVEIASLAMDRERSAVSVNFRDGSALLALLNRDAGFLLALDEDGLGSEESVRISRFGRVTLHRVEAPADERTIVLWLAEPDGTVSVGIAIELHTNRWNVVSLVPGRDGDGWRVRYAMWTREVAGRRVGPGEPYIPAASTRRAIDAPPGSDEWRTWVEEAALPLGADPADLRGEILRTWGWTSAINYEWAFEEGARSLDRYLEIHESAMTRDSSAPVWLTERRWGLQPYPLSLGQDDARPAGSVFEAMEIACDTAGGVEAALAGTAAPTSTGKGDAELLATRLQRRVDREAKRVAALERQLAAAGPPEAARELGQILLARKDAVSRGDASVVLQAFDGSQREIALDPKLDAVANAERFFEEGRRRERALERLPAEIASATTRLAGFRDALVRLERDGPSEDLWRFAGEKPPSARGRGKGRGDAEERLPYTRLLSSGGLEIRVGRGARDNDELTFRHSAPDDIWLHASQVSGAHVILRWGRKEDNPPQRDLLEAAVAAAVGSGARHSGSVAVAWTRRKYVRKARKSPPGTVIPDRVKTVMVEPDEDLVRGLREAAEAPPTHG